jgi:hypothetical protein
MIDEKLADDVAKKVKEVFDSPTCTLNEGMALAIAQGVISYLKHFKGWHPESECRRDGLKLEGGANDGL